MSRVHPHPERSAAQDHFTWRRERLVLAGFSLDNATSLAGDTRIDLHKLLELVDAGCAPDLAARIVAPLDTRNP
jgi:hypothetical protein